jgi:DMSO/TMAO reductase YedYZ molybdopterin-dependent catalytic subunit
MLQRTLRRSSLGAIGFCLLNYAAFIAFGTPLWTDAIAEWIMARTPNAWSVALLSTLGEWAKPFAATGGLAAIGFVSFLAFLLFDLAARSRTAAQPAAAPSPALSRRDLLTPLVMTAATGAVAVESFARNRVYARRAATPQTLYSFSPPPDTFAPGLVRPNLTPLEAFYGMSKNTVDPVIDPQNWRLRISLDGRLLKAYTYAELLALPRIRRITTMRCVSNTLKSNLMGTAEWSGIFLRQLIDPARIPAAVQEVAFLGSDGHDDSIPTALALSEELLLALGMNGRTLDRVHGFPFRLIAPRYYGFKSVKWLAEIRLVTQPYSGTWPRMGYTKEPVVHTMSFVDHVVRDRDRLDVGGVAFAGLRGIRRVELRAGNQPWVEASLESPLSPFTWTRWKAQLIAPQASFVQARALDGTGRWQAEREKPLFPDGVAGPTIKNLT